VKDSSYNAGKTLDRIYREIPLEVVDDVLNEY